VAGIEFKSRSIPGMGFAADTHRRSIQRIHLCFLDELASISLFDAFSNCGPKAILLESAGYPTSVTGFLGSI
jgi:hypothetical protein